MIVVILKNKTDLVGIGLGESNLTWLWLKKASKHRCPLGFF